MKRYRLKKDLPTLKAGEEFYISYYGHLVHLEDEIIAYTRSTLEKFPNILKDWFEEIPEKPKTVWNLEEDDVFYMISYDEDEQFCPRHAYWRDRYEKYREIGEVFLTDLGCRKEIARRKAEQILLRDTKGFKPDWHDTAQLKYRIYYEASNAYCGNLLVTTQCREIHACIHFATRADAEESVRTHRKEWLTYLGAEE